MNLRINGDQVTVPGMIVTVVDLLAHFGLQERVVIIELNESILQKSDHAQTKLSNGDRVEIVHFVGGG